MVSQYFYSLAAFSLAFHCTLLADALEREEGEFEEVIVEENVILTEDKVKPLEQGPEVSSSAILIPQAYLSIEAEQKEKDLENKETTASKKLKPQYAGARRPAEKVKNQESQKKNNSRIKNKWFSSKTHPKVEKKETVQAENASSTQLPADRPHYAKTSHSLEPPRILQLNVSNSTTEENPPHRFSSSRESGSQTVKNATGGFQAPKGHVFFTGEWLYWRTREEGMEYATSKRVNFDFQSGFRVGLGVHFPYDYWEIDVNYTRFTPESSHQAHGSFYPLFLFQGAGIQGSRVTKAQMHWEIEFQNIDVEISRAFYIAKTLVFRPFFGLKGAWIDQDAHVRYQGGMIPLGQTFRTHFENDFKGAGPWIGLRSHWLIGAGFNFFAEGAAALIVGHFDNKQEQRQLGGVKVVDLNSDFNLVSPMVQVIAGLAWDRNFNQERAHVGLSIGFESQYWWEQNQTEQFTDKDFPIYIRARGDLAFYGLTLRARFDF